VRGSSELVASGRHLRFAAFLSGSSRHNRSSASARTEACLHQDHTFRCHPCQVTSILHEQFAVPPDFVRGFLLNGFRRPSRAAPLLSPCGSAPRTASPELCSCAITDSLVNTSAYVCLRVPATRAPRSSSCRPFHYAPPVPHPHTHACTSSSCSATSPGARPLHAPLMCRSCRQFASACARVPTPATCSAHTSTLLRRH
jgi:hypothetical protein